MLWGIGISLGAGIGAALIKFLDTSFVEPIVLIFIISAIIRLIVVVFGLPKLKEVRKTKKLGGIKGFEHLLFKETGRTILEEVHELKSIKRYLHTK